MKFYVIIVSYNGDKWIRKCLDSVVASSVQAEIVVVDNQSSDDTITIIKKEYPQVYLIEAKENLGFGKANNIGLKLALENNADFVFLLNQDAWVEPDTFGELINVWHNNREKNFGILSPIHLSLKPHTLDFSYSLYLSGGNCPDFISDLYFNNSKPLYEIQFVNAAGWLISGQCLQYIGGFDPLFFHYGEDNDYCRRVLFHKFKIGICTNSILYHARDHYPHKITTRLQKVNKIHKKEYIQILLRLKAFKVNFRRQVLFEIVEIGSNFTKSLLILNLNGILVQLFHFIKLLKEIKKIHYSRQVSRQLGATFLKYKE